jgi:hypothetical protein
VKRLLLDGGLVLCARCTIRAATHLIAELNRPHRILCCQCYVAEGNEPAAWHPDCQQAVAARRGNGCVSYATRSGTGLEPLADG